MVNPAVEIAIIGMVGSGVTAVCSMFAIIYSAKAHAAVAEMVPKVTEVAAKVDGLMSQKDDRIERQVEYALDLKQQVGHAEGVLAEKERNGPNLTDDSPTKGAS
jgi:hypothetical protein